jgi:hypothetical protein
MQRGLSKSHYVTRFAVNNLIVASFAVSNPSERDYFNRTFYFAKIASNLKRKKL